MAPDIIPCPSCGTSNRVPPLGSGKAAVCGKCKTPLTAGADGHGQPVELSDATFDATIGDGGKYVVDFWAPWCGPCRMIAPILEQLAAERTDVRFAKINVDDNQRTSGRFGVQGIPLLVFFAGGQERGRLVGAHPRPNIEAAIRQYLS
jgi:thioredoxin